MQHPDFTDEELMAYADGELGEARAAELDQALAGSAALADRLAIFVDTRILSKEAWSPALEDPVPPHLIEKVRALAGAERDSADTTVVSFPQQASAPQTRPFWQVPLAAGLALAIGLGAGVTLPTPQGKGAAGIQIAALEDTRITDALNTLPSGEALQFGGGARLVPIATFYDGRETLCREFELDRTDSVTIVSVACLSDGAWDVRMAVAASARETGYAPASSLDVLDAYLTASEAGPPLEPEAEAAALAALR